MAWIHRENCRICHKEFQAYNDSTMCSDCYGIKKQKDYKKYMIDIREAKTLEQRIEQIEDWIYEQKINNI